MSDTVTVACKTPNGVRLRVFKMEEGREPVMGGGTRKVQVAVQDGEEIMLRGVAAPAGMAPRAKMLGGFALTPGVPKEFWERWLSQNKDSDLVRNGLVFAQATGDTASMRDNVKDNFARKSGMEPVDPKNLPKGIEQAEEQPADAFADSPELVEAY